MLNIQAIHGYRSLHTDRAFKKDETVSLFRPAKYLRQPDRDSLQIAAGLHILLDPEPLTFINHSCRPNTFFDLTTGRLVALKDIAVGEELTCFYPATEWDMAKPFSCRCGDPKCLGLIRGAGYVPQEVLARYRTAEHVRRARPRVA